MGKRVDTKTTTVKAYIADVIDTDRPDRVASGIGERVGTWRKHDGHVVGQFTNRNAAASVRRLHDGVGRVCMCTCPMSVTA